jgi:hypothetical protein
MKKYIVVSTNNNPDYYFYAPYIEKAWNSLGWDLVVMATDDVNVLDLKLSNPNSLVFHLPNIEGVRTESIAQSGRLYASNYLPSDSLIMTSDMDMLPLSNYWIPFDEDVTVYGHDLTGRTQYPICYICMSSSKWMKYMNLSGNTYNDLKRDAEESGKPFSSQWEVWWDFDQDMITKRLSVIKDEIVFVDRGFRAGSHYAKGRVDRSDNMTIHEGELIDCHCDNINSQHPDKLSKFLNVYEKIYGKL